MSLTKEKIKKITASRFWQRGIEYFNEKRVKDFEMHKNTVFAKVGGTYQYNVAIKLDGDSEINSYSCDCPAAQIFDKTPCKHVVAVLLETMEYLETGFCGLTMQNNDDYIGKYFNLLENDNNLIFKREELLLEIKISYDTVYSNEKDFIIKFRVGSENLYIIKDVRHFLINSYDNEELYFSKGFTYNPKIHCFNETDTSILEYIKNLAILEKELGSTELSYSKKLFHGKEIRLNGNILEGLLKHFVNRNFILDIDNSIKNHYLIKEYKHDIKFNISESNKNVVFEIDYINSINFVTSNWKYIIEGNDLYKLSEEQRKYLIPFIVMIKNEKTNKFAFNEVTKNSFFSKILPVAQKIGEVEIKKEIEDIIEKHPLVTDIYLDKVNNCVSLEIIHNYGEHRMNAIRNNYESEKIIIRENRKEEWFLEYLMNIGFIVKDEKLILDSPDKMYDFVTSHINELMKNANVFYSDEFKTMKVRKTIKYSVAISSNEDWLQVDFDFEDINKEEMKEVMASLKLKKKYHILKDGSYIDLEDKEVKDDFEILNELDFDDKLVKMPIYRAMQIDGILNKVSDGKSVYKDDKFKELIDKITKAKNIDFIIPKSLKGVLRDYQKTGFRWMSALDYINFGGILADDMGIGKTVQSLAFLLAKQSKDIRSLIIVPTSLIYNWKEEVLKFTKELKTLLIMGKKEERVELINSLDSDVDVDIVITTYPLLRRDIDLYIDKKFDYCIIDEAQHIKNPNSMNAKSVKAINAKNRFALTGTPIENNLVELWSIFDFVMPGYFYSLNKFKREFDINKSYEEMNTIKISKMANPFILRRMKIDVLKELPEKIETHMVCEMSPKQKIIYMSYKEQIKKKIEDEIYLNGFNKSHIQILAGLTRLRQICNDPKMFIENYDELSGKIEMFNEIVSDAVESGHRLLVFSQFTKMLAIIKENLDKEGKNYFYLDGQTKVEKRMEYVDRFNKGEKELFLISLKAGGTGLNLTGADMVIHIDPWWNPAVEDQATDRAYRIGQEKTVQVFKLITKGTIEEKMINLQNKKRKLISSIIKPGEQLITKLSEEEIKNLFE